MVTLIEFIGISCAILVDCRVALNRKLVNSSIARYRSKNGDLVVMKFSVSGKKFSAGVVGKNPDAVLRENYLKYIAAVPMRNAIRRRDLLKCISPHRPSNYSDCGRCNAG